MNQEQRIKVTINIGGNTAEVFLPADTTHLSRNNIETIEDGIAQARRECAQRIWQRVNNVCDDEINCSADSCLADKEIQVITTFAGEYPSSSEIDAHVRRVYEVTQQYNKTLHRATHQPHDGRIKSRLMVGHHELMLNKAQVNALITDAMIPADQRKPVEKVYTFGPQEEDNCD